MGSNSDGILGIPIRFVHEQLGLSPNQLSVIGLVVGLAAAVTVAAGAMVPGLGLLALSQIIDGLDGGVARKYNLGSKRGEILEVIIDRLNELAIFLALVVTGAITLSIAVLAFTAILLITAIEPISKFDPGFKRFMLYFGYLATVLFRVQGFQIAMQVIFFANLIGFAIGTVLVDYRLQREIDAQEIIRRQVEASQDLAPLPGDPPSFLSKLFS